MRPASKPASGQPVTVVVGIAVDSTTSERAQNFMAALTALRRQTLPRSEYRVVIVEQGTTARMESCVNGLADQYIFAASHRSFNRSWVLNIGAMTANEGLVCTFDADLIAPPDFLRQGLLAWRCGALAIKPYSEVVYLDAESSERLRRSIAIQQDDAADARAYSGSVHPWSKGGCVWVDAGLYRRVGGHDERFEGWGDEDRDFWRKLTNATKVVSLSSRVFHLYHARDFEQHPDVRANRLLLRALEADLLPPQRHAIGDPFRYSRPDARDSVSEHAFSPSRWRRESTASELRVKILKEAHAIYRQSAELPSDPDHLHLQGLLAADNGEWENALACLRKSVALIPSASNFRELGRALRERGHPQQAINLGLRAITLAPDDAASYRELGRSLHRARHLAGAVTVFKESLFLEPADIETYRYFSELLCDRDRLSEALNASEIAMRMDADNPESYRRMADIHVRRKEWDLALSAYQSAVDVLRLGSLNSLKTAIPGAQGMPTPRDVLHATLWRGIGECHLAMDRTDAATDAFRNALMRNPYDIRATRQFVLLMERLGRPDDAVGGWASLGTALEAQHSFGEAVVAYRQALGRKPDCLRALIGIGRTYLAMGQPDRAIQALERAVAVEPASSQAHTELGRACYTVGMIDRAFDEFAWFCTPNRVQMRGFEQPLWDGSPQPDRTLLIWVDQELGDTIQGLRYVPLLRDCAGRIVVECQPRLASLVRSLPGVDQVVGKWEPLPAFDMHVPLTLIPILRRSLRWPIPAEVPYLTADRALVDTWRQRLASALDPPGDKDMLTVGISWAGHPDGINGYARFTSLSTFASLARIDGIRVVSLQMGPQSAELLAAPSELSIVRVQTDTDSVADTAALIQSLDLVVTVDTMLAHLAGAMARPVWVVLPRVSDWRWFQSTDTSPMYPTMRLFRQTSDGDWPEVFRRVRKAIQEIKDARLCRAAHQ